MEVSHQLYHLLHLLCLSFAVGLAYLALERFRYSKRISKIFDEGIGNALKELNERNPHPGDNSFTDTAITKLRLAASNPYKYGGSFFFGVKNSKGNNKLWGTDQTFVTGSLVFLFILICFCTIKIDCLSIYLFCFVYFIPILVILFTLYLVILGNIFVTDAQNKCESELNALRKTYNIPDNRVDSSVDTLADLIKLFGKFKQQKKES